MKYNFNKLLFCKIMLFLPTLLFAAGFQSNDLSPRLQGQAGAGGGAAVGDVTAIFINPAVLSTLHHPEIYIGGSYDAPRTSMKNATAQHGIVTTNIPNYDLVKGTSNAEQNILHAKTLPAFYAVLPVNQQLTFGISFTSPWSYQSSYNADSVVRYMAQNTNITSYNLSGLLSYAVTERFSVATGIQGQYFAADISNFDGYVTKHGLTTQASATSANNLGLGFLLGTLYSPTDNLHVGLSYRSYVDYQLHGHTNQYFIKGPQANYATCTNAVVSVPNNCYSSAQMKFSTPDVLNLSLAQQVNPQWQVAFTTQVTFWSEFKGIDIKTPDAYSIASKIEQDWQNVVLYSLGSNYQLNTHWTLRGGIGYDQTPTIINTRDARIPDNNKILTAIGATYQLNQHLRIDVAYEHAFMQNQHLNSTTYDGTQRAYPPLPPEAPLQGNQVSADYAGSADIIGLGLNYLF